MRLLVPIVDHVYSQRARRLLEHAGVELATAGIIICPRAGDLLQRGEALRVIRGDQADMIYVHVFLVRERGISGQTHLESQSRVTAQLCQMFSAKGI
jgi:hypothetical protein